MTGSAAAAACGAALGTKWTLAPFAVVMAALVVPPMRRALGTSASVAAVVTFAVALVVAVAAWAPSARCEGDWCLPPPLASVQGVAADSWSLLTFHVELERDGPGHAPAWTWVGQTAPTELFAKRCAGPPSVADAVCGEGDVGRSVIEAEGNRVVWVLGTLALGLCAWRALRRGDRAAGLVVVAAAALWVPWLIPFTSPYSFYGAPLVPFLALAIAVAFPRRGRIGASLVVGAAIVTSFVLAYPSLTGLVIR